MNKQMTEVEQKKEAKKFVESWKGRGYEKGESQSFWLSLLGNVFGVVSPEAYIDFERQVKLDHTSFIDGVINETHVVVEQKSIGKDLRKAIRQSDGSTLTPFQQAKRYSSEMTYDERPRWIVLSNFEEFHIYDMNKPSGEPEVVLLENLPTEYYRLSFLTNQKKDNIRKEEEISIKAGDLVGKLYDGLIEQYHDKTSAESLHSLNLLCVRLVFCMYAEDAGLFGNRDMFYDYLKNYPYNIARQAIIELFEVLNTKPEDRDPYLNADLAQFPYVNGGLFEDKRIEIPQFTEDIYETLLNQASRDFDWSKISPTIFGAVFESTLNPETRRSGGMHYTSIENIHKVIDPLFLNDLKDELEKVRQIGEVTKRNNKLAGFQQKLASLTFLDPACGSGNFLTETYLEIRRLENETIRLNVKKGNKDIEGQVKMLFDEALESESSNPIKVSIAQFYGIEINDFASTVAKTALWIAEAQMLKETEEILYMKLDFLPLKSYANIVTGNSLRMDWNNVVQKSQMRYIMGNPPFLGYSNQDEEQAKDMLTIYADRDGKPYRRAGKIDYVSAWYFKASEYINATQIHCAFVSTNSITQGDQVTPVWKPLFERFGISIDFCYRSFIWTSEAKKKAAVHCVIIGFSSEGRSNKYIYDGDTIPKPATIINPYLLNAPVIFLESRSKPLYPSLKMTTGNRPADGGHLIIENDEYEEFIKKEPDSKKYIKRLVGADEYINNKKRYCLWLVNVSPTQIRSMPEVLKRVSACREDRLKGAADRRKLADTPHLFRETRNPNSYMLIPLTSSENRRYIPFGFFGSDTIPTNAATIIENATLYEFGILISNVHMSWMRAVAGRLEMRYRYSKDIVYNNFPWPEVSEEQKEGIKKSGQMILKARSLYPDSTPADLYNEVLMPKELREAHRLNDKLVMQAYNMPLSGEERVNEEKCVQILFEMYKNKVGE
ncbi:type I restriction-modification system DNA methylase subunit [Aequitasia blattaphilus]|uniref:site-specific DNA-methyltransferase (adenine-specific) n=1 Tax=Aequitasia blattaphilus TaxID=2949332 RepID=A0ABT1EBM9_9FIRM|nr:DNA methyltransferase [Aequitasia blattaphilus]MCP1103244.1 methylase [Aequitasia blattaphilus]MCR8615884.1 methylase [Aequitasia blattaphilus]